MLVFQNCGNTKFSQANLASTAGQVILTAPEGPSENSPGTTATTTSGPSNTGVTSTTYLNGVKNNWTIISYNYAAFGWKNCKGYQGPCTGKVIGKMAVGDLSGWGPGGCVDIAQASQEIKCFEKPSSGAGDCNFYDGPADLSAGNRPGLNGVDCSEIK